MIIPSKHSGYQAGIRLYPMGGGGGGSSEPTQPAAPPEPPTSSGDIDFNAGLAGTSSGEAVATPPQDIVKDDA